MKNLDKKQYVASFIFNSSLTKVLLIHKNRPDWQKGKMNGVGGKIEPGEQPIQAIVREVWEESGLKISGKEWDLFAEEQGIDWKVYFFTAIYQGKLSDMQDKTDEHLEWVSITLLPNKVISNLHWLIPLSLDKIQNKTPKKVLVEY